MKQSVFESFNLTEELSDEAEHPLTFCYSGRKTAANRQIKNGDFWFSRLQSTFPAAKFKKFDFADMDVKLQISEAKRCDVFFGPHGQNLQNSVYMPLGSLLVEVFPLDCGNLIKIVLFIFTIEYMFPS